MADIAQLEIRIKSTEAAKARQELDKLTKASNGASLAGERLVGASRAAGAGIAILASGAVGALVAVDRLVKSVAEYQDLADKTGGSAAGFASLQTAADVAGTSVAEIAVNLSKVDEEGDEAARALKAIGLSVEQIRAQRPDEQVRTIAQALAGFSDGAGKAAIAAALYGRGGAELLPVLKELGQETERVTYLTNEQIAAADQYADDQARLKSQLQQLAQAAGLQAAPALIALLNATRSAAEETLGLSSSTDVLSANRGVQGFATSAVQSLAFVVDAGDGVVRVFQSVGTAIGAAAAAASLAAEGEFRAARQALSEGADDIDRILQRTLFSDRVQMEIDALQSAGTTAQSLSRQLSFSAQPKATGSRSNPFAQEVKSLQERAALLGRNTELERVNAQIALGKFGPLRSAQQDELRALATAADARQREVDQLTEAQRARERAAQAIVQAGRAASEEAAQIRDGNEALQDEIASLGASELAKSVIEQARIRSIRLLREERLAAIELFDANALEAQALREQITALKERELLLGERGRAERQVKDAEELKRQAEKTKDFAKELGLTFSSAFEDAIVEGGKLQDILKGLEQDIVRIITRKFVTEPLTNSIGGYIEELLKPQKAGASGSGGGSGGSGFGAFASVVGEFFSGFFADGGYIPPGRFGVVGEEGPEVALAAAPARRSSRTRRLSAP